VFQLQQRIENNLATLDVTQRQAVMAIDMERLRQGGIGLSISVDLRDTSDESRRARASVFPQVRLVRTGCIVTRARAREPKKSDGMMLPMQGGFQIGRGEKI
jgi:hypothetical protein